MKIGLLELHNFRRFRDARFEPAGGLVAVVGPNGAGKSTLLEALGFALFGAAATRTAKELLRHDGAGPSDAVQVVTELELGGQALRIVRELRGKNLTPSASLEADGALVVRSGAGSNEAVTAEVERRLGMDREAFFTTVVARQRELGRLAQARPAERKSLLLGMLGVERVDQAIAAAREERGRAVQAVEAWRAVLPAPGTLEGQAEEATTQLRAAEVAAQAAHAAFALREQERTAAQTQLEAATADAQRHALAVQEREHWARRIAELDRTVATVKGQAEAASAAAKALSAMGDTQGAWDAARRALEDARAAAQVRAAWEREQARHMARVALVDALGKRLLSLEAAMGPALEPPGAEGPEEELARLQASLGEVTAHLKALDAEDAQAARRRAQLAQMGPDTPCPTCERPLGSHLQATLATLAQTARDSERARADLANRRQELASRADMLRAQAIERREQEARRARLGAERDALRQRVGEESQALAQSAPGPEPLAVAMEAPLRAEAAAAKAHQESLALRAKAQSAGSAITALAATQAELEAARASHAQTVTQVQTLASAAKALEAARAALHRAQAATAAAVEARLAADGAAATARARVEWVTKSLAEAAVHRQRLAQAEVEAREWSTLVDARRGLLERFRDHLVARVGPAISAEASRLLALFTRGRYTDVLLDDDHEVYVLDGGTRYTLERFSGGESDLVHLALRLAVSRLLAERSGTDIRFLALDEVFGSLDRDRRDAVTAALGTLDGVYSQILLISHLDGLEGVVRSVVHVEMGVDGSALRA